MKLSTYAKHMGVCYLTAYNWFKAGRIQGYQMETGTIIVTEPVSHPIVKTQIRKVAIYARVSAAENKDNLEAQAQRVMEYCTARGYQVAQVVKEVGSGVNDTRPKLMKLLTDTNVRCIVCEHKDRLARSGFHFVEELLKIQGREVEVINLAEEGKEDLMHDFVSIVTSFCARLYGQRRSKGKTERIIAELKREGKDEPGDHEPQTGSGECREAEAAR